MDERPHEEPRPAARTLSPDAFAVFAIGAELLLVPSSWGLAWLWPGEEISTADLTTRDAGLGVLATVPLVAALAVLTWTPLREWRPVRAIRDLLHRHFGTTFAGLALWQILAISCAAGVGEELLFRATLQSRIGLVATSVLFGMLHWLTFTYFVLATLTGLYLGWLFQSTDKLLVPIVAHALYDAVALLVLRRELKAHFGG